MTRAPLRLLVVDDHPLFRAGVIAMLDNEADMQVVAECGTGAEAIDAYRAHHPDVVVTDLMLPDMEGDRVTAALRQLDAAARVIVLTTYAGDAAARRALEAGALGYLLKTSLVNDLAATVRAVHAGQRRLSPEVAQQLAEHHDDHVLSAREIEVLRGVAEGLENKQIAVRLALSADTVKEYLSNAMGKLHATNRAHALALALERGFLR